jgi:hypothetical protein
MILLDLINMLMLRNSGNKAGQAAISRPPEIMPGEIYKPPCPARAQRTMKAKLHVHKIRTDIGYGVGASQHIDIKMR